MKINIQNLISFVKKGTLNNSINNIFMKIEKGKISTSMVSETRDVIVILNIDNNVLLDVKKGAYIDFSFDEPNRYLVPYLNLVDENEVDIETSQEKLTVKQGKESFNIQIAHESALTTYDKEMVPLDNYIKEFKVDDNFLTAWAKIKKIGNEFGKIYFTIKDGSLYIETTDKKSAIFNGYKKKLFDNIDYEDSINCYSYTNFFNLMSVISDNYDSYTFRIVVHESGMTFLYCRNEDTSEVYCITSKKEVS